VVVVCSLPAVLAIFVESNISPNILPAFEAKPKKLKINIKGRKGKKRVFKKSIVKLQTFQNHTLRHLMNSMCSQLDWQSLWFWMMKLFYVFGAMIEFWFHIHINVRTMVKPDLYDLIKYTIGYFKHFTFILRSGWGCGTTKILIQECTPFHRRWIISSIHFLLGFQTRF
jgi:hypothetical protein